jgi:hypothetical protein
MLNNLYSKDTINADVKLQKEEIVNISKLIYKNKEVDEKYIHFVDNLTEQINIRKNVISNEKITDKEHAENLACDNFLFDNWVNKKILDLNKNEYNEHKLNY